MNNNNKLKHKERNLLVKNIYSDLNEIKLYCEILQK